jgi:hypothetical protein
MCFFAIWITSFVKVLFSSVAHFFRIIAFGGNLLF